MKCNLALWETQIGYFINKTNQFFPQALITIYNDVYMEKEAGGL